MANDSHAELRVAARAVAARLVDGRVRAGGPGLDRLPEPDNPLGVAGFAASRLSGAAVLAELADVATICRWARAEADRVLLAYLRAARAAGATWAEVADEMGLRRRQDAHDLMLRLEAGQAGLTKSGRAARAARRAARAESVRAERARDTLRAAAVALAARADGFPPNLGDAAGVDVAGWAAEVAGLPAGRPLPAGVAAETRLLVQELRGRRDVLEPALAAVVDAAGSTHHAGRSR